MSINRRRGEVAAQLNGREYKLCLTLGALAELESAFAMQDLNRLLERFASGRLSARDLTTILVCGLKGGGQEVSVQEVQAMQCEGGVAGFAQLVSELLMVTFAGNSGGGGETINP